MPSLRLAVSASLVSALVAAGLGAGPAASASTGSISGTVTRAADGAAMSWTGVTAYRQAEGGWEYATYTETDGGAYTLGDLAPGSYRIFFEGDWDLAGEYWPDAPASSSADVVVAAGGAVAGIDAALDLGGQIAGTVTREGGAPVRGALVRARQQDLNGDYVTVSTASTSSGGDFMVRGLQSGPTRFAVASDDDVVVHEPAAVDAIRGQYVCCAVARTVAAAHLRGTVTAPSGAPVRWVTVSAQRRDGEPGSYTWSAVGEDQTDATGHYAIHGLRDGTYRLHFGAELNSSPYVSEYWNDARTAAEAAPVELTVGEDRGGLDVTLDEGAQVSGSVTSAQGLHTEGFAVTAQRVDVPGTSKSAYIDYGDYTLVGLAPGLWRIDFFDWDELHLREYWKDTHDQSSATLVEVTDLGQVITGVDAVMDIDPSQSFLVGPTIAGTPKVGSSLTASAGAYPSGGTTTFHWLANGIAVPGATSAGYIPTSADAGKVLSVRVQVSGYGLRSGSGTSAATAPVAPGDSPAPAPTTTSTPTTPMPPSTATPAPVPTSAPTAPAALSFGTSGKPAVSGRAKVGTTLSVRRTGWSVDGARVTYAWLADGKAIKKATKARLQLSRALVGKRISVRITATRGSERIVVRSRPTARVKA